MKFPEVFYVLLSKKEIFRTTKKNNGPVTHSRTHHFGLLIFKLAHSFIKR